VSGVGYTSAVVLAVVLAGAGVAKLRAPRTTTASFSALGLPAAARLARVVPHLEVAVAASLVTVPRVGAVVAAVLLVAFTGVVAVTIRRGVDAGCACFGAPTSRPVSGVELARNAGLLALAAAAAVAEQPVVPAFADVVLVTTAVAVAVVGLTVLDTRHEVGRLWDNRLAGEA
jgi:hypothetical protein